MLKIDLVNSHTPARVGLLVSKVAVLCSILCSDNEAKVGNQNSPAKQNKQNLNEIKKLFLKKNCSAVYHMQARCIKHSFLP